MAESGARSPASPRRRTTFAVAAAVATFALLPMATDPAAAAAFSNSTPINGIVESGTARAQPYPSNITVAGMTGTVTDVDVGLCGFSATFPEDVDILLVGPGGRPHAMFMSDVGGNNSEPPVGSVSGISLSFSDQAANAAPQDARLSNAATYRPTDDDDDEFEIVPGDSFPAPAPAAVQVPANTPVAPLSTFNGIDPNGTWSLYVVDDFTAQPGQGENVLPNFSCGWSVQVTTGTGGTTTTSGPTTSSTGPTTTASSTTTTAPTTTTSSSTTTSTPPSPSLVCSSGGVQVDLRPPPGPNPPPWTATPYPSDITVAGRTGTVTDVDVILEGFRAGSPSDLDLLLVGPGGQNLLFMSDVGGNNDRLRPVSGINLRIADEAATRLPADAALTSGTFKPRDDDGDTGEAGGIPPDSFPAPAPAPSTATRLSVFDGSAANGTWRLYMVDDFPGPEVGSVGRWCLDITAGGGSTTTTTTGQTTTTASSSSTTTSTTSTSSSTTSTSSSTTTTTTPSGTSCFGAAPTIVGTAGNDTIFGTSGRDVIVALGGNDTVESLGGDDLVCAGDGDDTVLAGTGNDRVSGGAGVDSLSGAAGDDDVRGDAGNDTLEGNSGNDTLDGGADVDVCRGGDDTDIFTACETERS